MAISGLRANRLRRASQSPDRLRLVVRRQCYGSAAAFALNGYGAATFQATRVAIDGNGDESSLRPLPGRVRRQAEVASRPGTELPVAGQPTAKRSDVRERTSESIYSISGIFRLVHSNDKMLIWLGGSKKDLMAFPTGVRKFFGHALDFAQRGDRHDAAKVIRARLKVTELLAKELRDGKAHR